MKSGPEMPTREGGVAEMRTCRPLAECMAVKQELADKDEEIIMHNIRKVTQKKVKDSSTENKWGNRPNCSAGVEK